MVAYLVIFGVIIVILSVALFTTVQTISNLKVKSAKQQGKIEKLDENQKKISELLKVVYKRSKEKDISSLN